MLNLSKLDPCRLFFWRWQSVCVCYLDFFSSFFQHTASIGKQKKKSCCPPSFPRKRLLFAHRSTSSFAWVPNGIYIILFFILGFVFLACWVTHESLRVANGTRRGAVPVPTVPTVEPRATKNQDHFCV